MRIRHPRLPLRLLGAPVSVAALTAIAALLPAPDAAASGFAAARFGGPHGNPVEGNATSIYYNPAGLALDAGTRILLDVNWALRSATYERDADALTPRTGGATDPLDVPANTGKGSVTNLIYSPMIGVATDFGTDLPFGVGVGFFAPFGGQAVWDQTDPVEGAPGAEDGPQRWYTIDGTIRTLAIALGAAYRIEPIRLSIGVSGNVYLSEIDTVRARTANGEDWYNAEGRSYISTSSTDFGLGVGLMAEPIEDRLWIGASWQSRPGFDGNLELEGELQNVFTGGEPGGSDVVMTSQLPDIFRLGARFRPIPKLELRLFGDLTRWSAMKQQCVVTTANLGNGDLYEYCDVIRENGGVGDSENQITLNAVRNWNDAGGVRLGGSYWLANDKVELMLDLGFDGSAIPDESLEPALFDMNKVSFGLGVLVRPVPFLGLALTATDIVYFERDTRGVETANRFVPPSRQPSSAGVYNQNIFVLNTGVSFEF